MKNILTYIFLFVSSFAWAQDGALIDSINNVVINPTEDSISYIQWDECTTKPVFRRDTTGREMINYITNRLIYPEKAKQNKIQGVVKVEFIINKIGRVTNIKILKGVSNELDSEVLRCINLLPSFEPGKHNGVTVNVKKVLPVNFKLN